MQTGADGSSESIGVIPNKLKGNCEALLLVLSALDGDTGEADLTSAAGLGFKLASVGMLPETMLMPMALLMWLQNCKVTMQQEARQ